jgi:Putative zinc-finger
VRQVARALPQIGAREGLALALVALVGRGRVEVAQRVGLDEEGLGRALAQARKQLRRTVVPLPGSGWCERAERLISDRLDGALAAAAERRLDAHLRNCPRCVEHERRLVQATDALVASVAPPSGRPDLAPVDETAGERAGPEEPLPAAPAEAAAEAAAPAEPEPPAPAEPVPPAPAEPVSTAPAEAGAEAAAPAAPVPAAPAEAQPEPAPPAAPAEAKPEPAAPTEPVPPAPALRPPAQPPLPRPLREVGVAVTWHALFALAVLLAVVSIALTVAGLLGVAL